MENFLEELKQHFEEDIKTNYIDNSKYNRGYLTFYEDFINKLEKFNFRWDEKSYDNYTDYKKGCTDAYLDILATFKNMIQNKEEKHEI